MRSNSLIIKELPILIVGQGLAGTVLAWQLLDAGFAVKIIDAGYEKTASRTAAGIINPITGKRFVKTWRLEELFPAAKNFYESLEKRLGGDVFFREKVIVKWLSSVKESNDWAARAAFPENKNWMIAEAEAAEFEPPETMSGTGFLAQKAEAFGGLRGAQIDLPKMLDASKKAFVEKGIFETQLVDYQAFTFVDEQIFYQKKPFQKVIFCEGKAALENPFFGKNRGWRLAKGEAFLARIDGLETDRILKKQILVAPLGDQLFWVGASYESHFEHENPSDFEQKRLESELFELVGPRFEVVKRLAAVRPTVIDFRPLIGWHEQFPSVGIFNGLGTKGTLLAPFFAAQLVKNLTDGAAIESAVNVRRFAIN